MTTLMDIVTGCEAHLGWEPDHREGHPPWQAYARAVSRLRRVMATQSHPEATISDLALALEYSRVKRIPLRSPSALVYRIPQALARASTEAPANDTAARIEAAILAERDLDDADSLHWIYRLVRCTGSGCQDVLTEWEQAGRGRDR